MKNAESFSLPQGKFLFQTFFSELWVNGTARILQKGVTKTFSPGILAILAILSVEGYFTTYFTLRRVLCNKFTDEYRMNGDTAKNLKWKPMTARYGQVKISSTEEQFRMCEWMITRAFIFWYIHPNKRSLTSKCSPSTWNQQLLRCNVIQNINQTLSDQPPGMEESKFVNWADPVRTHFHQSWHFSLEANLTS